VKMNALVEPAVIDALYRASQAGVRIDLLIRGICCLRAGLPGASDTIRVISIVDRFLEHSRVFYFENAGEPEVFLASADWMPRNFFRRIEVMFPIKDPRLKSRIVDSILPTLLGDNVKARSQRPDGSYGPVERGPDTAPLRSQVALQGQARDSAREVGDPKHRLFVPIVRQGGRNGGGNGAGGRARRPARRSSPRQTRKKPAPES
jgi:polyphosphate kinase